MLAFLQRYYLHTAPEDLTDRDPVDVFGAAFSHYRLAENRPQGTANVRVHTPDRRGERLDLQPLRRRGRHRRHALPRRLGDQRAVPAGPRHPRRHPPAVRRPPRPHRQAASRCCPRGPSAEDLPHDAHVESWIHVEIDRETDRADLKQITADLLRVLSDVREAVEDWEKMRDAALRIAEELPKEPTADDLRDQEVEEARELLRWLADDHFTFLGYREYQLRDDDSLAAVPGTGLGILRSDPQHGDDDSHPVSPSFERLPADARAKAREHKLLVLTKANSRATVHRPSYLDYVGVKKFDAERQRHRRAPLPGPVLLRRVHRVRAPGARRPPQGRRGPARRRASRPTATTAATCSRSWRPTRATSCSRPRPTSCGPSSPSVLYLQERRRLRLYLRQDEYGRYYSALVYLPRDRYTTGVRLRIIDILKEELDGTSVDFTAWNTESILSRLHFVVRVEPGTELPQLTDADKERIEARLVEAARSWADGFAEALTAECGEERAAELLRRYGNAFPEGYKADHSPRSAVADLVHLEALGQRASKDFALSLYEPVGAAPGERRFKIYRTGEQVSLSAVLPALKPLGVEVIDERPYELRCADRTHARGSTTSGCACPSPQRQRRLPRRRRPASGSRRPSPPPGPDRPRTTASTPSC